MAERVDEIAKASTPASGLVTPSGDPVKQASQPGLAERLNKAIDTRPRLILATRGGMLLGALLGLWSVVWSIADSMYFAPRHEQELARAEAIREGRFGDPPVLLRFDPQGGCSLTNASTWPVLEATVTLQFALVNMDTCKAQFWTSSGTDPLRPANEDRELEPRETVRGETGAWLLRDAKKLPKGMACEGETDCMIGVVCEARYLRYGDRNPYVIGDFAFVTPSTDGKEYWLQGASNFVSVRQTPMENNLFRTDVTWQNERIHRAHECLSKAYAPLSQLREIWPALEETERHTRFGLTETPRH